MSNTQAQTQPAETCCGNSCSERDIDVGMAEAIRNRADRSIDAGDVKTAHKLIPAARALLERQNAMNTSVGLWVLNTEGLVACKRGNYEEALATFLKAEMLSSELNGPDHPATGVMVGNYADTLLDRAVSCKCNIEPQAIALFERAICQLQQGAEQDEENSGYWQAGATEFAARLEKARTKLARPNPQK